MRQKSYLSSEELEILNRTLTELAPDEIPLMEELAVRENFEFLRQRSGALGFGVHEAVEVITPTLFVVGPWAWAVAMSEFQSQTSDRFRLLVRRAFGRKAAIQMPAKPTSPVLSEAELRALIEDAAIDTGLNAKKAMHLGRVLSREIYSFQERHREGP